MAHFKRKKPRGKLKNKGYWQEVPCTNSYGCWIVENEEPFSDKKRRKFAEQDIKEGELDR
jgi:hypothetical protein